MNVMKNMPGGRISLGHIIASSIRGINIRSENVSDGIPVNYINIKEILPGRIIPKTKEEYSLISREDFKKAGKLRKGDIVITSKGAQFKASVVDEKNEGGIISLNVIGIRLISDEISPEYIVAYLNCPEGQAAFRAIAKGAVMPSINLAGVKSIFIPVVSHEIQETLIKYLSLARRYVEAIEEEKTIFEEIQQSLLYSVMRG
jgi:restriction endonuclease S subunit